MRKYYSMPSSNGWFLRGGSYNNGTNAGSFYFIDSAGWANTSNGARAVLLLSDYNIVPKGNFSIYKLKDLYHK